jgi:serine protease Do
LTHFIVAQEEYPMRRVLIAFVCFVSGTLGGAWFVGPYLHGQTPAPLAIPKDLTSYREIVKHVLPAVVSIETTPKQVTRTKQSQPKRVPRGDDSPVPPEFRKFFDDFQMQPNDVPHHGIGSGFFVDPKGVILTNYHVVKGADQVTIVLSDGRKLVSKDIKTDPRTDLAVIRVQASTSFPFLELGDSAAAEIGDRVLAVGAPFGYAGSVTAGIISGKSRSLQVNMYEDYLQTDAAINPGNSGGPLVTMDGHVVGINTAIKSSTGGSQGVGLAITSNEAKNVMQQLLTNGAVVRGYLGVQVGPLDAEVASRLGLEGKSGLVVGKVFDGSPAAKAGIQAGDVITSVANTTVKSTSQLQHTVATLPLNKATPVMVFREGKAKELQVTIEEQPSDFGLSSAPVAPSRGSSKQGTRLDKIGIEIADLTPQMANQLGVSEKATGPVVTQVDGNGLGGEAGLRSGTLILKVDQKAVKNATEAQTALDGASLEKGILLQVRYPEGATGYVLLKAASGN